VHISELAQHHVENPREVVAQGDPVNVLILEVDAERRRLSLSLKRVEEDAEVQPRADGGESVHTAPRLDLSEDVFSDGPDAAPPLEAPAAREVSDESEAPSAEVETEPASAEAEAEAEPVSGEAEAEPMSAEAETAEPEQAAETAEPEPVPEPDAEAAVVGDDSAPPADQ
jgi:small subunit ribosomal protein S1